MLQTALRHVLHGVITTASRLMQIKNAYEAMNYFPVVSTYVGIIRDRPSILVHNWNKL